MVKYNLDKLVKVNVIDFYKSSWYVYQSEYVKGGFWKDEIKIGFHGAKYSMMGYHGEEAPKNHILKNGVVYEIPEVRLYFQSNIQTTKYFDTLEEATTFAKDITNDRKWLLN